MAHDLDRELALIESNRAAAAVGSHADRSGKPSRVGKFPALYDPVVSTRNR